MLAVALIPSPAGAQPARSQPVGAQPVGAQPVGAQPVGAQPVGAQPVGAQPVGAQPAGSQPSADDHQQNLARYQQIAEDLGVTIAQTHVMRRQIDDLRSQIAERRALVGRVAAATYRGYRVDPLYVLADAGSTDEALRRLMLVSAFAERRQQEIDALSLTRARYDATQRTLEALIAQQRSQQQALVALRLKIQQPR